MFSCHLLIASAYVRSIKFLSFLVPILAWNVPLVSLIFLKSSLVFPILLISSISLHWSLFSSVQSLSHVRLFATPRIASRQASLSITSSQSSLRFTFIQSVMHPAISSSVVPFSSCPQSLTASESFPMNQHFAWGCQSIGVSTLASVLPMNIKDWFPLGWTGWISLQSKGLSRLFSNTTVQKHQFFGTQLSL